MPKRPKHNTPKHITGDHPVHFRPPRPTNQRASNAFLAALEQQRAALARNAPADAAVPENAAPEGPSRAERRARSVDRWTARIPSCVNSVRQQSMSGHFGAAVYPGSVMRQSQFIRMQAPGNHSAGGRFLRHARCGSVQVVLCPEGLYCVDTAARTEGMQTVDWSSHHGQSDMFSCWQVRLRHDEESAAANSYGDSSDDEEDEEEAEGKGQDEGAEAEGGYRLMHRRESAGQYVDDAPPGRHCPLVADVLCFANDSIRDKGYLPRSRVDILGHLSAQERRGRDGRMVTATLHGKQMSAAFWLRSAKHGHSCYILCGGSDKSLADVTLQGHEPLVAHRLKGVGAIVAACEVLPSETFSNVEEVEPPSSPGGTDSYTVLLGHKDGRLLLWDTRAHGVPTLGRLPCSFADIQPVCTGGDASQAGWLTADIDGHATLSDPRMWGRPLAALIGYSNRPARRPLAVSCCGQMVAAACADGIVRVWETKAGRKVASFTCPSNVSPAWGTSSLAPLHAVSSPQGGGERGVAAAAEQFTAVAFSVSVTEEPQLWAVTDSSMYRTVSPLPEG